MAESANALRWDRRPGHYEVYYLTLTDPATGVGAWIRYTMVAPLPQIGESATASLWFLTMDPRPGGTPSFGRKATYPINALQARSSPFELAIDGATLRDDGMSGSFEDVSWDLRWAPQPKAYEHVDPRLARLGVAQTVLVLPHADVEVTGTISFPGVELGLERARGGQAHLWGSKHAHSWAWAHCNDFSTPDGDPSPGDFVDGVSVIVRRFGREVGPNTPIVGRFRDDDFESTAPTRILTNDSTFALASWHFEAIGGKRKLIGQVDAKREQLAGVTYHDPDGELAYCYNSETASMRLDIYDRRHRLSGWMHRMTLVAPGRAHFEYAQRTPVPELVLHTT